MRVGHRQRMTVECIVGCSIRLAKLKKLRDLMA
jgi:hypothetical protein